MSDNTTETQTDLKFQVQRTEFELNRLNERLEEYSSSLKEHVEEGKTRDDKYLDILDKISTQVNDTQKCLALLDQKMDLSVKKLESEIKAINRLDEQQNRILEEHIAGVNTLKAMHELQKEEVSARLVELEKPGEWLKMTRRGILWIGGLSAAILSVLKFFEVF